jgi:hypothetical protein
LERPAIYSGDGGKGIDKILSFQRKGRVKAPSFLSGFIRKQVLRPVIFSVDSLSREIRAPSLLGKEPDE